MLATFVLVAKLVKVVKRKDLAEIVRGDLLVEKSTWEKRRYPFFFPRNSTLERLKYHLNPFLPNVYFRTALHPSPTLTKTSENLQFPCVFRERGGIKREHWREMSLSKNNCNPYSVLQCKKQQSVPQCKIHQKTRFYLVIINGNT